MSMAIRVIIDILLVVGCFFALAGVVGMLRMPDAYSRMQSSTNIATLGLLGVILAALVYAIFVERNVALVVKLLVVGVLAIMTNPVGSHAISRAAYRSGVRPTKPLVCDAYGEDDPHGDAARVSAKTQGEGESL